jgi:small subunit ribosomal protein S17
MKQAVETKKTHAKEFTGKVVSNKTSQTVIVEVIRQMRHPIYGKTVNRTNRIAAHAIEEIAVGSRVIIREVKPISKTKHFIVKQIVKA